MKTLIAELSKPEYAALTDEQALDALKNATTPEGVMLPATTVNQKFAELDLTGFIDDIAATQDHPFRHKMASVNKSIIGNHPFNFIEGTTAGDGNLLMLDMMIKNIPELSAKMTAFRDAVHALANRKQRPFADVSLPDVVAARAVQLDGQWHEIEETTAQWLQVQLNTAAPESTHIVVQWQGADGEWYHAQAIHGLLAPVQYRAQLPYYGVPRKLRWKCEYLLHATMSAV
jgi:hypothetical protein